MKTLLYWLLAYAHESYCIQYWTQVECNEWWLRLLTEQTKEAKTND
jgi:hypothetical protein